MKPNYSDFIYILEAIFAICKQIMFIYENNSPTTEIVDESRQCKGCVYIKYYVL
jgi:hypothetical protein